MKKSLELMIIVIAGVVFILPFLIPINQKELHAGLLPFPESKVYHINDSWIHYREWQPDSVKGNVLFVHGFSGSTFSWRNNVEELILQGYRVIAVDLPAYGYSDKSTGINHSNSYRAEVLWNLLSEKGSSQWSLIGHSMGAGVVATMAAMDTGAVSNLILVSGGVQMMEGQENAVMRGIFNFSVTKRWAEVIGKYGFYNYKKFENLLTSAYGQHPDSAAVKGYLNPFLYGRSAAAIFETFTNSKPVREIDYSVLHHLQMHAIWGEKDSWVPLSVGKKMKENYSKTELFIIDGACHCPMETHSREFNTLLLEILNK
jgi:2-hydroxy-6-oxonona-2,4-dienedioate hydrolase